MTESFEPQIIAFCCNYCSYAAADLAGSTRITYPANIKIIRVPCSGRVDTLHLIRALEEGADGVFVAGCLEGDCHFKNGNVKASRRVKYIKELLDEIGIGAERLEMVTMSAGMGAQFASTAEAITEKIRQLGPNPIKGMAANSRRAVG